MALGNKNMSDFKWYFGVPSVLIHIRFKPVFGVPNGWNTCTPSCSCTTGCVTSFMDIAYTFGCQYLMVDHLVPFSCKLQKHDINYYSALFFDKKLLFRLSLYCQLLNKQVQDVCPSENHLGLSPPYLTCISCRHVTFCRRAPRPSFAYLVPHVSAPTSDEQINSLHIRDSDYSEGTTPRLLS